MLFPVQGGAGLGQLVVAVAGSRNSQGHVGRVGGDLVRHATLLDVIILRQTQVLLRRDVAEHARPVIGRGGGADATGDVVVTGEHVGHERTEHVKRRSVAKLPLELHVVFDLVERHVSRPFDHHLHALAPGPLGQLAQRDQLGELGRVGGVGQAAGTQAITDRERNVVAGASRRKSLPTCSYIGFCLLWTSIHLARSDPPRLTMPISRLRTKGKCSRRTPA